MIRLTEVFSDANAFTGVIDDIELGRIRPPADQVRTSGSNITGLAVSINEQGLLQPIIVRPIDNHFEIVAGNRRYEACKSLGWRKITCHIGELEDKQAFEVALVENIQRRTLNPIEEAKAFKAYTSIYGWGGATELAIKLGKSTSYVSKRIALLELPPDVIVSINNSVLSGSIGEELCSLKNISKQSRLAQLIAQRHLSVRRVRDMLENDDDLIIDSGFYSRNNNEPHIDLQKTLEKSIVILRIAMNRLGTVIENLEDDSWMIREILLHHKNIINGQIDALLKEKRKCTSNLVRSMKQT